MSQCVPSWDLDENPNCTRPPLRSRSRSNSTAPDVPMLDYEVAELTWENGQLAMHGLGPRRVPASKAVPNPVKYTWSGTLESVVNQATSLPLQAQSKPQTDNFAAPARSWFDQQRAALTMDALVPCSNRSEDRTTHVDVTDAVPLPRLGATCVVDCSTRVGSCSGPNNNNNNYKDEDVLNAAKRARVAYVPVAPDWSTRDQSYSASATFGIDSQHVTRDTYDLDQMGVGFTSTSLGSPENTSSAKQGTNATTIDDHDSVCHSRPPREAVDQKANKSTISTKRSRAAAIHNQSERKRRDKINQRMKTLQKLVPNSSKTDKASMLDEVIEYLKQLQGQVQMMSRMNMPPVMLPLALQQQLQMAMMSPMGMGLGMGMGMGMGAGVGVGVGGSCIPPSVVPPPFMPIPSWEASAADRLQVSPMPTDPFSAFIASQSQPMTMDAYSRMAAMYQQMQQQQPPPSSSNKT